ncbi:hypothetical protein FOL47_009820 [Perkinsus chesapeaki]|uniref:Uncharacterized protein n=1 Tax=Perkinsus chesapeaki TaxID=330153 RepID=A0A7J6MR08_PERCH|nr:hypothetical protein FOL47_009820 [Perkinsus chesapeaki]
MRNAWDTRLTQGLRDGQSVLKSPSRCARARRAPSASGRPASDTWTGSRLTHSLVWGGEVDMAIEPCEPASQARVGKHARLGWGGSVADIRDKTYSFECAMTRLLNFW